MARQSRFYLARILKRGALTGDMIVEAMREPATIDFRGTRYSFTDLQRFTFKGSYGYVARLAKYKQEGAVSVVQEVEHVSAEASVPNLIDVSSQFVYIPEFGGLAYRHVWGSFPRDQFERVFSALIANKFLLVGCDIEAIVDLRTFVMRLARLDIITELSAKVFPPNPLFGPCWKSLSEYLRKRNLKEASIREYSDSGIQTRVKDIATAVSNPSGGSENAKTLMEPLLDGVGDAALLMAADGYGRAKVAGREADKFVVIRTSENQKSFLASSDSPPEALFEKAYLALEGVSDERSLEHP